MISKKNMRISGSTDVKILTFLKSESLRFLKSAHEKHDESLRFLKSESLRFLTFLHVFERKQKSKKKQKKAKKCKKISFWPARADTNLAHGNLGL